MALRSVRGFPARRFFPSKSAMRRSRCNLDFFAPTPTGKGFHEAETGLDPKRLPHDAGDHRWITLIPDRKGILMSNLSVPVQVGQRVKLQETEQGYVLTLLAGDQPGDTVITVGGDYLLLEDAGAEVQLRLPMFLIRSVLGVPASQPQLETELTPETPPQPEVEAAQPLETEMHADLVNEAEMPADHADEPQPEYPLPLESQPEPAGQTQAA
jgi:hypothetical protein